MVDRPLRRAMLNKCGLDEQINIEQGTARSTSCRSFSCLTNLAAGLSKEKLSHKDLLDVAKKTAVNFARLLQSSL
jgi:purine nucleoside phosphorylase